MTCLPSENGVRLYAAGPGPSTPAREILSSSLERKTASACLRDEYPASDGGIGADCSACLYDASSTTPSQCAGPGDSRPGGGIVDLSACSRVAVPCEKRGSDFSRPSTCGPIAGTIVYAGPGDSMPGGGMDDLSACARVAVPKP